MEAYREGTTRAASSSASYGTWGECLIRISPCSSDAENCCVHFTHSVCLQSSEAGYSTWVDDIELYSSLLEK